MISRVVRIGRTTVVLCIGATALLCGCPMYSADCDSRDDCAAGFYCDSFSERCEPLSQLEPVGCTRPEQCAFGETCTPNSECRPGSCDYHGCVRGYACSVVDSVHTCVAPGDAGNNPGGDAGSSTGPDAGSPGNDAGTRPTDAGADASL